MGFFIDSLDYIEVKSSLISFPIKSCYDLRIRVRVIF